MHPDGSLTGPLASTEKTISPAMKRDTALATAIAASLGYVIVVGVTSSPRPAEPVSPNRPVAMLITFAGSGRVLRLTDLAQVHSISQWIDNAFENPRSLFDTRVLPPPINELQVEFESGQRTTIWFSGRRVIDDQQPQPRSWRRAGDAYVLQYEGSSYTIDEVPWALAAYLEPAQTQEARIRELLRPDLEEVTDYEDDDEGEDG